MDPTLCQAVFGVIAAIAVVWWFIDLWVVLSTGRGDGMRGEAVVSGSQQGVSKAILRSLRQPSLGMVGVGFNAVEQNDGLLRVEKVGAQICNQPQGLWFSEAEFRFEPAGEGETRVQYVLGNEAIDRRLRGVSMMLVFMVALPVLVAVLGAVWFWVVNSANPALRWQVFQAAQVVHALWPPLLLVGFLRMANRAPSVYVDNLLASLDTGS
ncbi:hypothetical protein MalM25_12060 [Planctomycetes bacterium MalM25]|nr:hypothetical protein MalM25_12060 [Planctomycetes bacterium MalM25]